jgi:hypothetical protein
MPDDIAFQDWVARAKEADIRCVADRLGAQLKKAGAKEFQGPCPKCGGTDRFSLNIAKQVFNCRSAEGGGVIGMVMHVQGCEFVPACEFILNENAPGRDAAYRPDPEIMRERRQEREEHKIEQAVKERHEVDEAVVAATEMFESAAPIQNTRAEDYLEFRGIRLRPQFAADLRFIPNLEYWGYADAGAEDLTMLGRWHAMVAAIRDVHGRIIGIHRTYIEHDRPVKLRPPGDQKRNKAKKVFRKMMGGLIRLGPVGETVAIGEGIETTLSWWQLGYGPEDVTVACGVNLGNMSGSSTDTIPHPKHANQTIQNGVPDPAHPGMILPSEVKNLILIGDGDSDPHATRAKLLTGARRFRGQGLEVSISMAPAGCDFNDVLRRAEEVVAA